MEKETFDDVWETVSISLAFLSIAGLVILPIFYTRLAFKYVRAINNEGNSDLLLRLKSLFSSQRVQTQNLLSSTLKNNTSKYIRPKIRQLFNLYRVNKHAQGY